MWDGKTLLWQNPSVLNLGVLANAGCPYNSHCSATEFCHVQHSLCVLQVLRSPLGSITEWQSSSGHNPNFAALSTGRHLYLAGWPHWTLAHILVAYILFSEFMLSEKCDNVSNVQAFPFANIWDQVVWIKVLIKQLCCKIRIAESKDVPILLEYANCFWKIQAATQSYLFLWKTI